LHGAVAARRAGAAGAGRARVADGAIVAVVAGRAVRLGRVRAEARLGIADAGEVALVERGADDRARTGAGAALAGVGLRAGVVVVARGAVGPGRVRADAAQRVAGAG